MIISVMRATFINKSLTFIPIFSISLGAGVGIVILREYLYYMIIQEMVINFDNFKEFLCNITRLPKFVSFSAIVDNIEKRMQIAENIVCIVAIVSIIAAMVIAPVTVKKDNYAFLAMPAALFILGAVSIGMKALSQDLPNFLANSYTNLSDLSVRQLFLGEFYKNNHENRLVAIVVTSALVALGIAIIAGITISNAIGE